MNVRVTVSITPELNLALTRAALDKDTSVSRQVEIYLRENPSVMKYIREIEADEYDILALASEK